MQNDYVSLKSAAVICTDAKEQLIECEAVLPDYYPEINKVLKCSVTAGTEDITVSGDKVSAAGKADIRLIYLDAEKHIRIFTSLVKYTRVFAGLPVQSDDVCFITQHITGVEHRAGAPRKCEIRATAAVKLTCIRKTGLDVPAGTDAPDAEICFEKTEYYGADAVKDLELAFSENVDLPAADGKINGVLCSSQEAEFTEIRVIKNKVMLKGCCEITARFVTDNGALTPETSFTVPFTEIAGLPGAEEEDECKLFADAVNARIAVAEDGKTAQVFVSAQIKAACVKKNELLLPADMYSVRRETTLKRAPGSLITGFVPVTKRFQVSSDAECYDDSAESIVACFADTPVCNMMKCGTGLHINGSVGVNFLVAGSSGDLSLISRTCNFDEDAGVESGGESFIAASACIAAASLKNGRIDYTLRVETRGGCVRTKESSFITEVSFEDAAEKKENGEKVILYYAHSGERIWDIAKENHCSAGRIKEFNECQGETVEENTMLVLIK